MQILKSNWLALLMAILIPASPRLWVEVGVIDYGHEDESWLRWVFRLHFDQVISLGFILIIVLYWWVERDRGELPFIFKFAHVALTVLTVAPVCFMFFWFWYKEAMGDYNQIREHPVYPMGRYFERRVDWVFFSFVGVQFSALIGFILLTRRRPSLRDRSSSDILDRFPYD